jgi:hypothetical protein
MFSTMTTLQTSSGECVRHAVVDITDQRKEGTINARLDSSEERWLEVPDNYYNRHAMEQFAKSKREQAPREWFDGDPRYAPKTLIHGVWQSPRPRSESKASQNSRPASTRTLV